MSAMDAMGETGLGGSENFIGFNTNIEGDLTRFSNKVAVAWKEIRKSFEYLFSELGQSWYSPKAVAFCERYNNEAIEIIQAFVDEEHRVQKRARDAYNYMAAANGAPRIRSYDAGEGVPAIDFASLVKEKSPEGAVGMKKEHIKNVIMPTFEKMIKGNCFDAIDDIPSGIKLYDSNNGMKQAYADGIRTLKVTVESAIDRLLGEMKSAVDQETEIVDTAKAQAVNTLSS